MSAVVIGRCPFSWDNLELDITDTPPVAYLSDLFAVVGGRFVPHSTPVKKQFLVFIGSVLAAAVVVGRCRFTATLQLAVVSFTKMLCTLLSLVHLYTRRHDIFLTYI